MSSNKNVPTVTYTGKNKMCENSRLFIPLSLKIFFNKGEHKTAKKDTTTA